MLWLGLFFCGRLNLPAADLGRHFKNGEIFINEGKIIDTNYYSYTQAERQTITHHWGAGVIFYKLWQVFGFKGLGFSYVGLTLLTFLLLFYQARMYAGFLIVSIMSVLSVPLIATRPEIRPEGFSYLFLSIFLIVLFQYYEKSKKQFMLWLLIVIQVIWVNVHIFFILGPFFVGVFLCDAVYQRKDIKIIKTLAIVFISCLLVSLINPFGVKGLLAPFVIFKEYGYELAENQSLWFMYKRFSSKPIYGYSASIILLAAFLMVGSFYKSRKEIKLYPYLILCFFVILGYSAIRGLSMFGWFLIPFGSYFMQNLIKGLSKRYILTIKTVLGVLACAGLALGLLTKNALFSPQSKLLASFADEKIKLQRYWIDDAIRNLDELPGLYPGNNIAAKFFKKFRIEGPIFNNYDIGGYLIFHLFPRIKVFVDNRPEAYSAEFFKKVYVPMQEDENVWKDLDQQYNFNAIFFYRQDITPWAQPFLIKRIKDPNWAAVYVDFYSLILLKRNEKNKDLIRRFEIPNSIFRVETIDTN